MRSIECDCGRVAFLKPCVCRRKVGPGEIEGGLCPGCGREPRIGWAGPLEPPVGEEESRFETPEEGKMHRKLCLLAGKWLKRRHKVSVLAVEPRSWKVTEQPDAIGWRPNGWSVLIEVKVSRADFLADRHKAHRGVLAGSAMGQERWYLVPHGLIQPDEVPAEWGLATWRESGIRVAKEPGRTPTTASFAEERHRGELCLLLSLVQQARCQAGRDAVTGEKNVT